MIFDFFNAFIKFVPVNVIVIRLLFSALSRFQLCVTITEKKSPEGGAASGLKGR